jgi:hypothetical protein
VARIRRSASTGSAAAPRRAEAEPSASELIRVGGSRDTHYRRSVKNEDEGSDPNSMDGNQYPVWVSRLEIA